MVFMDGVFETCEALVKAPEGRVVGVVTSGSFYVYGDFWEVK